MESSQTATVPVPTTTVAGTSESATASTGSSPTTATNSPLPEAATPVSSTPAFAPDCAKDEPTVVLSEPVETSDQEQREPKIEQVTPADMEPQTPPTPVSAQEAADPLAVSEETPEISTTSAEPEKPLEENESVAKASEQTKEQEQDPLAVPSNDAQTPDQLPKPSTSSSVEASADASPEVSESIPTSTSSPAEITATDSSTTPVVEEPLPRRSTPVRTPPPVVESSTCSPEKLATEKSPAPDDGPTYTTSTSAVDSSSGDSKAYESNVESVREPSSNCSDSANSINNDCSSSSHGKEAESPLVAAENGSSSQEANTTTNEPGDRTRSSSAEAVPTPAVVENGSNAVIEKRVSSEDDNENSNPPNGVVIARQGTDNDGHEQESGEKRSEDAPEGNSSELRDATVERLTADEELKESGSDTFGHRQCDETQPVASSTNDENTHAMEAKDTRETSVRDCRDSAALLPGSDPGLRLQEKVGLKESKETDSSSDSTEEHLNTTQSQHTTAIQSSREDELSTNGDSRTISNLSGGGVTGRTDYQQPPVSARNPLQFTEVANDEVELKVDGGHLLDRVIKLSLLKGLQDSGKRLAKSSLIISGAGATAGEGANGEATLATTSSLSKAKSAAAGLRLMEEHKTTPPALVANGGGGGTPGIGEGAQLAVKEVASSTKEVVEPHQHQHGGRIRHSSDTTISSSPSGELDGGVRSSSNSSLDFREDERPPTVVLDAPSSLEAGRSTSVRDAPPTPGSNDHLPMKARKPQYYASIPDFSKQQFSSTAASTVPTSTTTTAKSLVQLHMKTPDFSRLVSSGTSPSSQSSPSSTTTSAGSSTFTTAASSRTTSELKISNPDFTKGFASHAHSHYSGSPVPPAGSYPPAHDPQQPAQGSKSPYVSQDTFSKLIKERNYISDLQLKNPPPPSPNQNSSDGQPVGGSPTRAAVVDTTSGAGSATPSYNQYRRTTSVENGLEQEPNAHVIQKSTAVPCQPPVVQHHAPKTWNPPEFSSKHFTQTQPGHNRSALAGGSNGAGPSSTSPSSRDPSPAPSSSSPHQSPYGPHSGGLVNYTGKAPHTAPTAVVGTERIIVNNVRTYYPEASVPTSASPMPNSTGPAHTSSAYGSLPKVKDPEFRLDHSKEQLLLQEGTIVTVKQPYSNVSTGRGQVPPHTATSPSAATTTTIMARSPSLDRREAQMLQNSQDILYRDYRQHKKPSASGASGGSTRAAGPPQGPLDRRSPYDPSGYYQPSSSVHHARPPAPGGAGSSVAGLMNPPPPNWPPGPGQQPPHQTQRGGPLGPPRSSPQDNGANPVSSPAPPPPPSSQHHHYQHHPQSPYHGQYKNAPSPVTGSTYGSSSSPAQPQGAGSKYPPQQHYPSGTGTTERRLEVVDRGVGSGYYKGLDYNMEQKFAEVYQAHHDKEKQAAVDAAHGSVASSSGRQPRQTPGGAAGSGSPGVLATPAGVPTKGPSSYGTGYEQYHAYYQQSQATPSPTSTPSPVPSPHHRKYSGPPSRDPSPLGQPQPQQQSQQQHHRYASGGETMYHIPPAGASPAMYMHTGPPKPTEQGTSAQVAASYYQSQPSSSSTSSYSGAAATYSNRSHHPGAVVSPSHPAQQSVISGTTYDRYLHPYSSSTQSVPPGQPQHHATKPPLPYPPTSVPPTPTAGRMQGPPPPLQSAPPSGAGPTPVIHPPVPGSKNIPVRVIATAPPAATPTAPAAAVSGTSVSQPQGPSRSSVQPNATSLSSAAPPGEGSSGGAITTPVIMGSTKRESPLDLSVKTVKTKADSTGCDDYAMTASSSSISSSSSSNSSNSSSGGSGRPRELVPKVDFSPNFQKHIPANSSHQARNAGVVGAPPAAGGGRVPEPSHHQNHATPSPTRHVSVISPAIPPGYDKKTDAYMSANYRAVGGPLVSPSYQYPAAPPTRSGPGVPPGGYEGPPAAAAPPPGSAASASSKSVYYPPTGAEAYGRPIGKSGSGSIVTGQASTVSVVASNARSAGHASAPSVGGASQPRPEDSRIADRKFVENMLKKKTSPSSDVMADLQAGKFPTRIPQGLVPKKRAAAAAAAAAAAEAAMSKTASIPPGVPLSTVPTPAKMAKYEELQGPAPGTPHVGPSHQGPPHQGPPVGGGTPFDGRYPNHPHLATREGTYPNYGTAAINHGAHQFGSSSKRPAAPEISNGPAVHPSVITTNYHHHPPAVLQQQHQQHQQQHQQQQYDATRYYQHHTPVPTKARDEHVIPVYHQPHLRGGSAAPYAPHPYGYPKDEPNAHPHPYPPHHSESMVAYHKDSTGAFRYADPLKAPPEHMTVHHAQTHIHYTGGSGPASVAKMGHGAPHPQHQQHHHHFQLQQQQHHAPGGQQSSHTEPMIATQYPPNVHPAYGPAQHHRGADQSVISKLRTSLELKEYEKQRINQLRKQPPGADAAGTDEDLRQKTSMVHAVAPSATSVMPSMPQDAPSSSSRFRTKGELKGYTPLPTPSVVTTQPRRPVDDSPPLSLKKGQLPGDDEPACGGVGDEKQRSIVPPADMDGASALDILDWGSACNEFVEQLQTGKKRGRRKRAVGTTPTGSRSWLGMDSNDTVPLVAEGSTDLSTVPKDVLNSARSPHRPKGARDGSESSSDEDKPLLLLRQQSQQQKDQGQPQDSKMHVVVPLQPEKVARNLREKQRFELEQKHEAKLGRSSSTDSETARVASAAAQRAKTRVRKLRHRSSVVPPLSLKSSDGDGDVTADGAEDDVGKVGRKRVPHSLAAAAAKSAKRKRSLSSSASSSSSEHSAPPAPNVKKAAESEQPRKRGRPKGTGAGAKRAQQSTSSRCQTGAIKQEPNENSDLSSDEEPRVPVRTPHKNERNGSAAAGTDSTRKREGGGTSGSAGGSSGAGGNGGAGGKAQQGKVGEEPTCNGGGGVQKEKNSSSTAKKKTRTHSRSKAETSGRSDSSSSSSSSSSSAEEEEEAEETMTRSRSKREAERRRSNSKVLRNDKIVENCPTQNHRQGRSRADSERTPTKKVSKARKLSVGLEPTPKRSKSRAVESDSDPGPSKPGSVPRKRTRLASKNALNSSSAESGDSGSSSDGEGGQADLSERLRSRKLAKKPSVEETGKKQPNNSSASKTRSRRESTTSARGGDSSTKKKGAGSGVPSSSALAAVKKSLKEINPAATTSGGPDHFYPGWEKEVYEYKRSLKVPPELITIDGGLYMHRISTSLPDLDSPHHSDGSETFSEIVKKLNQRDVAGSVPPKRFKTKAAAKQQQLQQQQQQQLTPGTSFSSAVKVKEEEQVRKDRKKIDDNEKFSSIIELLHRRCIAAQGAKPTTNATGGRGRASKGGASKGSNSASATTTDSTKQKQEFELLPTPGAESESLFSKNSKKKKSLFDTAIFKSRTRTEQKAMQSKEMIREVFGGDGERPQSAPPLSCGPEQPSIPALYEEGLQNVTYDEKYNEIMRNVDRIVGELDGGGVGGAIAVTAPAAATVKQEPPEEEEDDEEDDDDDEDDDTQDGSVRMKDSERDTPSIASERGERDLPGTPLSFNGGAAIVGTNNSQAATNPSSTSTAAVPLVVPAAPKKRGRGHRTSRRKGSSGFDYIRKKKKPSQQHHHANQQQQHGASGGVNGVNGSIGVRKVTAFENMEGKDETHISKEIRSWVLNKGVGESVMHKAARLGYTDVIVYCLERLDMDPDLKDNAGYTPLHEACAKGHLDIANYLLQYGASHSEPAPSGMRPLHEAVENSFVEIVRLLLAFGADPMLATYAGMTPMQLAESDDMTLFLEHHLSDVQSMAPNKTGWKFEGSWKIHDPEESGCNIFSDIPVCSGEDNGDLSSLNTSGTSNSGTVSSTSSGSKRCDSNSNIMHYEVGGSAASAPVAASTDQTRTKRNGLTIESLPAGLRNGKVKREQPIKPNEERLPNGNMAARTKLDAEQHDLESHDAGSGEDGEDGEMIFEYEEADRPLPPLYVLKDEYNERWMLMSDLCNFLKFKSKEAVLRQICPNNSTNNQRELIREMKIEEFLARANCLQLLCAGEKLNIHASKVVLVKYNDSVKNLLQVQSVMTRI